MAELPEPPERSSRPADVAGCPARRRRALDRSRGAAAQAAALRRLPPRGRPAPRRGRGHRRGHLGCLSPSERRRHRHPAPHLPSRPGAVTTMNDDPVRPSPARRPHPSRPGRHRPARPPARQADPRGAVGAPRRGLLPRARLPRGPAAPRRHARRGRAGRLRGGGPREGARDARPPDRPAGAARRSWAGPGRARARRLLRRTPHELHRATRPPARARLPEGCPRAPASHPVRHARRATGRSPRPPAARAPSAPWGRPAPRTRYRSSSPATGWSAATDASAATSAGWRPSGCSSPSRPPPDHPLAAALRHCSPSRSSGVVTAGCPDCPIDTSRPRHATAPPREAVA